VKLEYQEYDAARILNVQAHVDGPWFWTKYSAHPYVGCRSGCEFCYLRGTRYLGRRDPATFDQLIQVKRNAAELLRGELFGREVDVILCGDWQQPAENRYRLSREMLKVILDYGFPLCIVERSPLIIRDLDLLLEINARAWVGVIFSVSNLEPRLKRAFEPNSPGVSNRFEAMSELAEAGIQVGTALMPIIPKVGDHAAMLEQTIRATLDHGGSFLLAGGLTMDGEQARRVLAAAKRLDADLEAGWRALYRWPPGGDPQYNPKHEYAMRLGRLVRELCQKHGLPDRMPRPILEGELALNKRIAERLFLQMYDLELDGGPSHLIWAYRKAAWSVDGLQQPISDIYTHEGEAGLRALPAIGRRIGGEIAAWLDAELPTAPQDGAHQC
jgi:DNA repair photolyase